VDGPPHSVAPAIGPPTGTNNADAASLRPVIDDTSAAIGAGREPATAIFGASSDMLGVREVDIRIGGTSPVEPDEPVALGRAVPNRDEGAPWPAPGSRRALSYRF
jgi:hypothetical protein